MPFSVPGVPPRKAFVDFPSGISVRPNDTFTTGLVRITHLITSKIELNCEQREAE